MPLHEASRIWKQQALFCPLQQIVIDSTKQTNNYQLILLAVEGAALCLFCVVWVWLLLRNVAARRFRLYSVLMVGLATLFKIKFARSSLDAHPSFGSSQVVPRTLVRRMATKRYRLSEEEEGREDEDEDASGKVRATPKQLVTHHLSHSCHSRRLLASKCQNRSLQNLLMRCAKARPCRRVVSRLAVRAGSS